MTAPETNENPFPAFQVLLLEDSPSDVLLEKELLEQDPSIKVEVTCGTRFEEGLRLLADKSFDVVLMDLNLPDSQGLETFERLREAAPEAPVIVLTGLEDPELATEILKRGAQDYLLKGAAMGHGLIRAIRYAIERHKVAVELETRVADRTAALAEANAELQRKNEQIQGFYHTLSHELKTPLTSAREFVSLVMEGLAGPTNPQQMEFLATAKDSLDLMRRYLDDLLDASRLDTGKMSLELRPGCLTELARRVVKSIAPTAAHNGIRLEAVIEQETREIFFDHSRIIQVVTNLINNAIKFTPPGGTIRVHAGPAPGRSRYQQVKVSDTGCGIQPGQISLIFERLYQVNPEDGSNKHGMGLGLFICRELIALHDGQISVESEPGKGSTFWFDIPERTSVSEDTAFRFANPGLPSGRLT
jgi:signal transduction histidine kinase